MTEKSTAESEQLFAEAVKKIPGGVNSPVRAFQHVGGTPRYIVKGKGARIWDADGNEYVDFCGSWGPMILGHAHPDVLKAAHDAVDKGLSFGACVPDEVEMANLLTTMVPSMESVRLVTSGTEATMTAVRLARAFTNRSKIVKFEGCYHGHSDAFLIAAGSGLLTGGLPASAGITAGVAQDTLVVPFNDLDALKAVFEKNPDTIAAIIAEPVPGNMGVVLPDPGYLENLIELAHAYGALVIFDEVINGFRIGPTSYAELQHLVPDLTTLGKIIGGGLPIGALGGRKAIMDQLAPMGPVYQAGTLSGNPVALAVGIATLKQLQNPELYVRLTQTTTRIASRINAAFERKGVPGHCASVGALFTIFFTAHPAPLRSLADVKTCDTQRFATFFQKMLATGFYLPPAQFEAAFLSAAHTESDIENFLTAVENSIG